MTGWLPAFVAETLIWTGLLIVLVLLIRRPVGRYFGARAAYALWLLPALRLIMPPLVLPAWLAPAPQQGGLQAVETTASVATLADMAASEAAAISPETAQWILALMAIWFVGTAIFMAVRFAGYFRMRRSLLADGSPVADVEMSRHLGSIRLVETPAASAPLALGVVDKVIVLPAGFMASGNREERDFALEHELAHHAGHDLLANMAVQPLFALHWFNPLAWLGWRAMRRDQEAACDARVIALRSAADKATYAQTIASFAAGPHASLAAPMACPVLGEKSIIHRLRSISMSDISPRRRFAGRALIAASLLALPLTASISYAEVIAAEAPTEALTEALPLQVKAGATYVPPVSSETAPKVTFAAKSETTTEAKPRVVYTQAKSVEGEKPKYRLNISPEKLEELRAQQAAKPKKKYTYRIDESKITPEMREKLRIIRLKEKQDDLSSADTAEERRAKLLAQVNAKRRLVGLYAGCTADGKSSYVMVSRGRVFTYPCAAKDPASPSTAEQKTADSASLKALETSYAARADMIAKLRERFAYRATILSTPGESIVIGEQQ